VHTTTLLPGWLTTPPHAASLAAARKRSATELVCLVGGESMLVGRSHECDYPPSIRYAPCACLGGEAVSPLQTPLR
jgi:hypothetical protein